jgi:hypothetical protein
MNADIDMSGRIEETNRPTAIAIANGTTDCVFISGRDKRLAIASLKQSRPQRSRSHIHILIFSSLLYLLLEPNTGQLSTVFIDPEYPGYDGMIKNRVMSLLEQAGKPVEKHQLIFKRVGKKSPAHKAAYAVFKGLRSADRVITARELLETFRK